MLYEYVCSSPEAHEFDAFSSIDRRNIAKPCTAPGCKAAAFRREIPSELPVAYSKERGEFFRDNVASTNSTRGA